MQFFIETERLILRDLLPEDAAGIFELDSDPEVHRYVGNKPLKVIEEAQNVIEFIRQQYKTNGIGRWAVIEKATGSFIGWAGLKFMTEPINNHNNYYDLGYRFIKKYWGKGYATEAALASAQYGWHTLNLKELYAIANADNAASKRVLEKTGMQYVEEFDYEGVKHIWYKMERP